MSTWQAGDPDREVLSYGDDEPPRRPHALLLGVAAGCLALGFVAGGGLDNRHQAPPNQPTSAPVAASAISKLSDDVDDPRFWLKVFNSGDESIDATVTSLPGWGPLADRAAPSAIAPHSWGAVPFSAAARCSREPGNVRLARLLVRTSTGVDQQTVRLAESGRALREYYAALCPPRKPVHPEQLVGVWLVEEGAGGIPVDELLMSFDGDGRFALDARGLLLTDQASIRGRYRLTAGRLSLVVDGGTSCEPGDRFSWDVRLLADGRLRVDHLADNGGFCRTSPQVWIARRLLADGSR